MIDGKVLIEKLLFYAQYFLCLEDSDTIYMRNILLRDFRLDKPYEMQLDFTDIKNLTVPDSLIEEIKTYAQENDLMPESEIERYPSYILGMLCPRPSTVNSGFNKLKERANIDEACKFLFDLCIKNNYINKTACDKNIEISGVVDDKEIEATINLSKPEKNNKKIAEEAKLNVSDKYPKCVLCKENEGFQGSDFQEAKGNLRVINLKLGGENWFMQYSPYQYFTEHCIAVNKSHTPMKIDRSTLSKLADFVDYFPNYFIGSNASLPIIGGSILSHEHFQGGRYKLPEQKAKNLIILSDSDREDVEIGIVDWFNTVIRVNSVSRCSVIEVGTKIIEAWENYDDPDFGIISKTGEIHHNSVTPILRMASNKHYVLDLILRNNITSEQYPDGVYHAHPEFFNIKSEGIGLIEATGRFILPARLKSEFGIIKDILQGKQNFDYELIKNTDNPLQKHADAVKMLIDANGNSLTDENANEVLKNYLLKTCADILKCTAVYKKDEVGMTGLLKFLSSVNIN